jgi:hypothetical protein
MVGCRIFIFVLFLTCFSCISCGTESTDSLGVEGAYTHTYTAEVIDPQTGEVVGSRTVRDTIFVKADGDVYEISNRKWLMNDYDNEGWVTEMPEADKPMPTYHSKYDAAKKKLIPADANKYPPLYVDDDRIYWGEEKALEYTKVDE